MSDEHEEAQYYQEHKDDDEEWGEPVAPPDAPQRSRMGATITVRFPVALAELIRATAERSNATYSEVVRRAVEEALRSRQNGTDSQAAAGDRPNNAEGADSVVELAHPVEAMTGTAGQTRTLFGAKG